jgi:hypothetical protein
MKTIKNAFLTLFLATTLISCSKDDQDYSVQRFDRNITFKVIGEYSGTLNAVYANPNSENEITPSEVLTTMPWQKNIDYKKRVKLTGLYVSGQNGQPNETVQLQVFSNGELIETEFAIADQQGRMYSETSVICFK